MTPLPLEDTYADVIGKAMRGLSLTDAEVAARAGVSARAVANLREGTLDAAALQAIAPVLRLGGAALADLAQGTWRPQPAAVPGLVCFDTQYGDMSVNSYLVFDPASGAAAAFDTGADSRPMLDFLTAERLTLKFIFLTHTHPDHIHDLARLAAETGAPVFVGDREPLPGAAAFPAGREFRCGALRVATRLTWGHSRGGISYVVEGLATPVAVVGDALFAGSMGGGYHSQGQLATHLRRVLAGVPPQTVIAPGHGPMTTAGNELRYNPFLA